MFLIIKISPNPDVFQTISTKMYRSYGLKNGVFSSGVGVRNKPEILVYIGYMLLVYFSLGISYIFCRG